MNLILNSRGKKVNGKFLPVHALKAYRGRRSIAPLVGGQWLTSRSGRSSPEKSVPVAIKEDNDEPQSRYGILKEAFLSPIKNRTPDRPAPYIGVPSLNCTSTNSYPH